MVPLDSRVHYSLAEKYSVSVAGETKTNAALPENQRCTITSLSLIANRCSAQCGHCAPLPFGAR